jgi:hypothetical protein
MSRTLGVWAKKHEVYLAVAEDGSVVDREPQRIEVPSIMDESERLSGFLTSFRHALDEISPEAVLILQPEQIYEATYSEFAPKLTLEALVRLACDQAGIRAEVLHRSTARSRTKLGSKGRLDDLIEAKIEAVGKYWNAGRKYAAVAALAGVGD